MATIKKGTYRLKTNLGIPSWSVEDISFTYNNVSMDFTDGVLTIAPIDTTASNFICDSQAGSKMLGYTPTSTTTPTYFYAFETNDYYNDIGWVGKGQIEMIEAQSGVTLTEAQKNLINEMGRFVTFENDVSASDTFATWFSANTEPYSEETTPTEASVKAKIQSLITKANTTTGKSDTDLTEAVLSLAEGYGVGEDSPLPIEVATESEMTALLETAEVGAVYKYTGTAGTYENGGLYIVEESE